MIRYVIGTAEFVQLPLGLVAAQALRNDILPLIVPLRANKLISRMGNYLYSVLGRYCASAI